MKSVCVFFSRRMFIIECLGDSCFPWHLALSTKKTVDGLTILGRSPNGLNW